MLPSNRDVLSRLYYLITDKKENATDSADIVADEIMAVYERFGIPTKRKDSIKRKILVDYKEYRKLEKSKNKQATFVRKQENEYKAKLDKFFDVAHHMVLTMIKDEKRKKFLLQHRISMAEVEEMSSSSDESSTSTPVTIEPVINEPIDVDINQPSTSGLITTTATTTTGETTEGSAYEPPRTYTRKKKMEVTRQVVDKEVALALDRAEVTNRGAQLVLSSVAKSLGHNVEELNLSYEHIRLSRMTEREKISEQIRETFSAHTALVVHWDSKVMVDYADENNIPLNRLAIILSGNGESKVLGIPKLISGEGKDECAAVFHALQEWNVSKNIRGMCFDTTSSNTGTIKGACALLQQKLGRLLLHFACRHHMLEIIVGDAFKETVEPVSPSPIILLFQRFKHAWPNIPKSNYKSGIEDPEIAQNFPSEIKDSIIRFIKTQLENHVDKTRYDYVEVLKLSLLFLGETIENYNIIKPGAFSRARWMAKIIYCMKIFLLRDHFKLTSKYSYFYYIIFVFVLCNISEFFFSRI